MINRKKIAQNLRSVIDPELGVNIVDLGLVYNILVDDSKITIEYTATTAGCPMRRYLQQEVEKALREIDGITAYKAELTWNPTWNVDMIVPGVAFFTHPPPIQ